MAKLSRYDGAILGAILGLIIFQPSIGTFFRNLITDIIPSSWDWFGSYSLTVFGVLIFAIIGLIVDKTGK